MVTSLAALRLLWLFFDRLGSAAGSRHQYHCCSPASLNGLASLDSASLVAIGPVVDWGRPPWLTKPDRRDDEDDDVTRRSRAPWRESRMDLCKGRFTAPRDWTAHSQPQTPHWWWWWLLTGGPRQAQLTNGNKDPEPPWGGDVWKIHHLRSNIS